MTNLNTRTRIIVITSVLTFAYFVLQEIDFRELLTFQFSFDPVKPFILALIAYLGTFWALYFKVRGERLITILMFPALGVFIISLFAEFVILAVFSQLGQLSLLIVSSVLFWMFTYISLLTVNILNTSRDTEIPLGQAARASQFVLSLLISYFSFFLLFSNDIFIFVKVIAAFLTGFLLMFISLWSIKLRTPSRLNASFAVGLLLALAVLILSVWPVPAPYLALVLSLILYVCLGISLEVREIISRWIWIEYIGLFVLISVMLSILAEWGINGTII